MAARVAWVSVFLLACAGNASVDEQLSPGDHDLPAGAACKSGAQCAGGTCLGAKGQPQEGNPRFDGGYCTSLACKVDTQDGCGPDEYCIDGGDELPAFCVKMCSKADGLECKRQDQVCVGLGDFGGCFSRQAVECNVQQRTGCKDSETCVRIGYDDRSLGRCETTCDPMAPRCPGDTACYFIRTYSTAFCNVAGDQTLGELCMCDKCCLPGLACTPDLGYQARYCRTVCEVATSKGCRTGQTCQPLKRGSPWGGCI